MGKAVGPRVADRFGRSLLELGGNNAAVVSPSATASSQLMILRAPSIDSENPDAGLTRTA